MEPKIRLKGFRGEWEETTFGNRLLSIQTGTNLLGSMDNKGVPLLKMGNIQRGYFSFDKLERLDESVTPADNCIAKYGDFFYNTRNTLELVGKGATWMEKKGVFAFNSNIARCTLDGINTIFFNYLYNTRNVIKQVQARAKGTTSVAAVYQRDLDSIEFSLPSIDEQNAIGAYFQHLDSLIQSTTKKIESLKQVKTASLQSMFPQEGETTPRVRFKGFEGEWEKVSLGEETYPAGIKNHDNLPLESFSISNEYGFIPQNVQFENGGTMATADKRMYYIVSKNSFGYNPARINVGSLGYYTGEDNVIVSSLYEIFKTSDRICDTFLLYWFKTSTFQKLIEQYQEGGVRFYFFYDKLCMCHTLVPSYEEQQKIADYFTNLDSQITLQTRRLEKLKQIKSACLDNMFV